MAKPTAEQVHQVVPVEGGVPLRCWTVGVPFEDEARAQLQNVARLPFVFHHVAVMPDVHAGKGATIGSVIATKGAIVPAAVGVDIGCGMMAVRTSLTASMLPDNLHGVRSAIEAAVPHGRTDNGGRNDRGAWRIPPAEQVVAWSGLKDGYQQLVAKYPRLARGPEIQQLGTLGTGNHFIEVCLDEADQVWIMLHSGSRGVGNRIGSDFIDLAKQNLRRKHIDLPDVDLAYLPLGTELFDDYLAAAQWAQEYARINRELMMAAVLRALPQSGLVPAFEAGLESVNCHHNYLAMENHFGEDVLVTRKGAVRARAGDMGIIPGSMGARSFIVRGLGNPQSLHSCSHGAGRAMSRNEARRRFTVAQHIAATATVECRKDKDVIDETPMAYKPIEAVMHAQRDLVEIVHTLRQVVCVKG
jgi:tRNA-splicing ligase RtcB (3'-phosphate/5'-hydroxy nucleic acid ligase)